MQIGPVAAELFHGDRRTTRPDEQTVAFGDFAKAPKNDLHLTIFHNRESLEVRKKFPFQTCTVIFQRELHHRLLTEAVFQRPSISSSSESMWKMTGIC